MTMDKPMNVCVLVGSLRKASFNGMLANALISPAPSSMKPDIVEIGQLPFYNQDLDTDPPPARWIAFRQRVKAADAVLLRSRIGSRRSDLRPAHLTACGQRKRAQHPDKRQLGLLMHKRRCG
jgi:hypothetical protein